MKTRVLDDMRKFVTRQEMSMSNILRDNFPELTGRSVDCDFFLTRYKSISLIGKRVKAASLWCQKRRENISPYPDSGQTTYLLMQPLYHITDTEPKCGCS